MYEKFEKFWDLVKKGRQRYGGVRYPASPDSTISKGQKCHILKFSILIYLENTGSSKSWGYVWKFLKILRFDKKKCVKCMGGWGIQPDLIQQLFKDKSATFQKVRWISVSAFIWDHLWVIWTWDGQVGAQKHVWLDSSPPHTLDHRKSPYRFSFYEKLPQAII